VESLAGTGGIRSVYRAVDRAGGGTVALEARLLADLRPPGIIRYVAHGGTPTGQRFLAMEWLGGESLSARLACGPLGLDDTRALAGGVAGGARARARFLSAVPEHARTMASAAGATGSR
jgi:serine/threonine protein kinase